MWGLMVLASNAIESVVMIKWVWAIIGVVVWFLVLWLGIYQEPDHRRTEAAVIGSLVGAVLGFIFPVILVALPFLMPFILAAGLLAILGLAVAHFPKVGK